ncbi:hypothetical protein FE257_008197 [Aspergillus nanangensis]|uniref:Uncharacterized protein n=1 Tax=Aspergillus nanangensis TaxID=2582783 RepID=A0AAD4CN69_ASPNN|nr:hypothetical protein FE257_008197 [Aspergillus nanangensis]
MPTLSGLYTSLSGRTLTTSDLDQLTLMPKDTQPSDTDKLRADGEFWLCCDDGLTGKFGTPSKVSLHSGGQKHHIWVEPRGFSNGSTEVRSGYSNRFLAINEESNEFEIVEQWDVAAKFRCLE